MGTRLSSTMRGLLLPDPRLGVDGLADNDATLAGSDYTQQGPRPGSSVADDPRARAVAVVTGGLAGEVEVEALAAGEPGIQEGSARVRWRFEGELDVDWRGHNEPQGLTHFLPVFFGSVGESAPGGYDVVVDPTTQRVIVIHRAILGTRVVLARRSVGIDRFEPAGTVDTQVVGVVPISPGNDTLCATILPSGRIIVRDASRTLYSDDAATAAIPTWLHYADNDANPLFGGGGPTFARMHATRDGSVLLMMENGLGEVAQFASRNLGVTWEPIATNLTIAALATQLSIVELPDGSLLIGYLGGVLEGKVRRIASPFDSIDDAAEVDVVPGFVTTFTLVSDQRGRVYALSGSPAVLRVARSDDNGATWVDHRWGAWDQTPAPANYGPSGLCKAVAARGMLWHVHGGVGNAEAGDRLGCLRLGGWTNVEHRVDQLISGDFRPENQTGWIRDDLSSNGQSWIPWDLPSAGSYTQTGAVPGAIIGSTTGALEIVTAAQDGFYEHALPDGAGIVLYASTSAQDNGGSLAALEHGIELVLTDGGATVAIHLEIRLLTVADIRFRVRDVQAGTDLFELPVGSDFVFDQSSGIEPYLELLLAVDGGGAPAPEITLNYRRTDNTRWINALQQTVVGTGAVPASGARFAFGAVASGTAEQLWRSVQWRTDQIGVFPIGDASALTHRQISTQIASLPFPLALAGQVDVDEARLAFRGGPATVGELHTIAPIFDFGVAAAMWDSGPSRDEHWLADDGTEQIIAWDFDTPTRIGGSFLLSLMVLDCNFNVAYLELLAGGVWSTVATLRLDTGFNDLHYARHGDVILPDVLGPNLQDGPRFVNRAELVGGVARWGSSGVGNSGVARIVNNSAGGWADSGVATIQPYIRVDDEALAGTGTLSDGLALPPDNLALQSPSGLVVAYLDQLEGLDVEGVRVRIPATTTPEGRLEAGLIMVGTINAFGQQHSRGYSVETRPNALRDESRHGTIRKHQQGDPSTRFSVAWPDGVKLQQIRESPNDLDYLGPAGKPPAVADSDVWGQLWGLLEETKSGEIPVVYIAELPPDGVTLTDRTLFGFGTLDGSARFDHVLGDENVNEFGRVAGITVAGIR